VKNTASEAAPEYPKRHGKEEYGGGATKTQAIPRLQPPISRLHFG
jgi:hypothetical protein